MISHSGSSGATTGGPAPHPAKSRRADACARCGKVGRPRQLDELLQRNRNEPVMVVCNQCVYMLKYADASRWKWFREYRDRFSQDKS